MHIMVSAMADVNGVTGQRSTGGGVRESLGLQSWLQPEV